MSKLSFRARALDAYKSMPIYLTEELPDLPEYSAINRAVPQMPSGMDKEEEREHHFQRAIITGLIIPTPEVTKAPEYNNIKSLQSPTSFKPFRQLIRMQPFAMEEEYPDYDMDSEDEMWLSKQKLEITPLKFEEMMDRLEKNCAQNFASQDRKELLLKDDDELSIAIYDYWLSKRLKTPKPLVPHVKTEANRFGGNTGNNNPYLAFRRRTEKMQTRKNRKNDEASYEKMIKLKRDLGSVLQLLELVKKREFIKKELVKLNIQQYEKRYEANDFSGALLAELSALKQQARPAFAPIFSNQYTSNHTPPWYHKPKEDLGLGRKEKRQYKRRKHKALGVLGPGEGGKSSGDEDLPPSPLPASTLSGVGHGEPSTATPTTHHHAFPFHRNKLCQYHPPVKGGRLGNWRWTGPEEGGRGDERFRYSLTSLSTPNTRCIGLARRRVGRGGRVILDRAYSSSDDFWSSMDFNVLDSANMSSSSYSVRHFKPKLSASSPPHLSDSSIDSDALCGSALSLQVESEFDSEPTTVQVNLEELFPDSDLESLRAELFGPAGGTGSSNTPCGSRRSLLQRVTECTATPAPDQPIATTVPSDHDYIGCSLFSFPERTRTNNRNSQPQIVVNTNSCNSSCNRVDNIEFVVNNSDNSTLQPPVTTPTPTTNGPTATDSYSWLDKSSSTGLPNNLGLIKGEYSPTPVLNSKLSQRPQTHIVSSENVDDSLSAKTSTPSLVNSHAMEVT